MGNFFVYLRPFVTTGDMGKARQRRVLKRLKGAGAAGATGGLGDGAALGELLLESEGDLETVFAEHLWPPPLLGLGQPGEHFGAARLAVGEEAESKLKADEEPWHEPIQRLMAHASGLIVVPSSQEGTLWEIQHLISSDYHSRTLYFLPPIAEDPLYKDRKKK